MAAEDWFVARCRVGDKQHKNITLDDKVAFFEQLATLVRSGTALLEAIEICAAQCQSVKLRTVLLEVAASISSGSSLQIALSHYPAIFERHWVEVIHTGEITGKMAEVLAELNQQIRELRDTRRKLFGAMMYPLVLVLVSIAVVTVLLWVVVPTFASMFQEMGSGLPDITQFVINMSDFVVQYGLHVLVAVAALILAIRQCLRNERGRRNFVAVALASPLIGELMVQSAMYRFASNTALLLKSGVPILEALSSLRAAFHNNPIYRDAVEHAEGRVAAGVPLGESLEDTGLFTSLITSMVRIGEESAQLGPVMEEIAPYYKEKMHSTIAKVTKLMEPIIIITMGIVIAVVMLSIYLPMFEMVGKVN